MCSGVIVKQQIKYDVANSLVMIALTEANQFDFAELADGSVYILTKLPSSTLGNWQRIGGATSIPSGVSTYVVADAGLRDALTGIQEGDICRLTSTKATYRYESTGWVLIAENPDQNGIGWHSFTVSTEAEMIALDADLGDICRIVDGDTILTYILSDVHPVGRTDGWTLIAQPTTTTGIETFDAASEAAMLLNPHKQGDICVRSDNGYTYRLSTNEFDNIAAWTPIAVNNVELMPLTLVLSATEKAGIPVLEDVPNDLDIKFFRDTTDGTMYMSANNNGSIQSIPFPAVPS